jgi:hypothetical protein
MNQEFSLPGEVVFISVNPALVGNVDLGAAVAMCNEARDRKIFLEMERIRAERAEKACSRSIVKTLIECAFYVLIILILLEVIQVLRVAH